MSIKEHLPKKEELMNTSVQVKVALYDKVKIKLKQNNLSFHDLVEAAMIEFLSEVSSDSKKSK